MAITGNTHSLDLERDSTQYASIADASQTGLDLSGDFTIEVWVKLESVGVTQNIASKGDNGTDRGYLFRINAGGQLAAIVSGDGTGATRDIGETNSAVIIAGDVGNWVHLALTWDASAETFAFYRNGSEQASTMSAQNSGGSLFNNAQPFQVGAQSGADTLDGLIDEVRVWSDIRTPQELKNNIFTTLVGNEANLVGYWEFNNNYTDKTSNNNDLTASGSPVFTDDVPPKRGVVVDARTSNYATSASQTYSHTVATGAILVVMAGNRDKGVPTAITYDSVAPDESYVQGQQGIYIWRTPSTGANNISITYSSSGDVSAHSVSLFGADTDYVLGATKIVTASGSSITGTLDTWQDNSLVLDFAVTQGSVGSFTADSGQTKIAENTSSFANHATVSGQKFTKTAGAQEMEWSLGSSKDYNHLIVEILADGQVDEGDQITRKNTSDATLSSGTSLTWSHTVVSNSNLLLVGFENSSDATVSSVTFNGAENLTKIVESDAFSGTREIWGLLNPTVTTANIVITFGSSTDAFAGAADYSNVGQFPTITDFDNISVASSSSLSFTTIIDNSWFFAVMEGDNGSVAAGTNAVELGQDSLDRRAFFDSGGGVGTAGAKSMTFTCAVNSNGGSAGIAFAPAVPGVVTNAVTDIGLTVATGNAQVLGDGGVTITERGVVWSTTTLPTTADSKSSVAGTVGTFTAPITGLTEDTTYYVRAYYINAEGTTYGDEVTFTTLATETKQITFDFGAVSGQTYVFRLYVGGTAGTVTVSLGSTGPSSVFNAGDGYVTIQGVYSGLNGLIIEADDDFDGYIDDVYHVLILGDATINWNEDNLVNVFPIDSSVTFKRFEDGDFNRFRIYRYLDVSFKDLDAYVTVLLTKEANQALTSSSKEFQIDNSGTDTLPFINKKISTLFKGQGVRVKFSNAKLNENFTICQFIVKGYEGPRRQFDNSRIISVSN